MSCCFRSDLIPSDLYNFVSLNDDEQITTNRSKPNSKYSRIHRLNIGAILN